MGHQTNQAQPVSQEELQRSWQGWVAFTKITTIVVVASVVILGLMALLLV